MKINPNIFRGYDIRGIYPDELNEEVAYKIARALTEFYPKVKKLVIAYDSRLSSPALVRSVTKGFTDSGKEVINLGIAPDPLFYFSLLHYGFDGGIMISGSHNPKKYNGMTLDIRKSAKEDPEDLILDDIQKIKDRVLGDFPRLEGKGKVSDFDPADNYINYVTPRINLKRPLKIVIDTGNGAVGYLPEKVFKKLNCQVKTIFGEPDGNFPHHLPDPYQEENIKDIKKIILEEKADLGFAFDGDGDRVAMIDNQGRVVEGDFCLQMLAKEALKKKKGSIAHDMRVSKAFLDEMAKEGVSTYFSVSFHEAVRKKIIETGAVFGGELTFHFFFPLDYYLCDDAVFASLKLAEVASEHDDLARYIDTLPRYFASQEIFIDSPDEIKFELIKNLQKYLRENNYDFIDVDGARINFPHGWALIRAANTTPIIKCRFEGETKEDLVKIEKEAIALMRKMNIILSEKNFQDLKLDRN